MSEDPGTHLLWPSWGSKTQELILFIPPYSYCLKLIFRHFSGLTLRLPVLWILFFWQRNASVSIVFFLSQSAHLHPIFELVFQAFLSWLSMFPSGNCAFLLLIWTDRRSSCGQAHGGTHRGTDFQQSQLFEKTGALKCYWNRDFATHPLVFYQLSAVFSS